MKILGRVTRDQLSAIYRRAHVFVLPTISDGFAVTQLEAMAHGLPVVTTRNCGEVVTDGVDGLLVPARDSQALADALARLNDDRGLLSAMSANALMTVLRYDLPSNARLINESVAGFKKENRMPTDFASPSRMEAPAGPAQSPGVTATGEIIHAASPHPSAGASRPARGAPGCRTERLQAAPRVLIGGTILGLGGYAPT